MTLLKLKNISLKSNKKVEETLEPGKADAKVVLCILALFDVVAATSDFLYPNNSKIYEKKLTIITKPRYNEHILPVV